MALNIANHQYAGDGRVPFGFGGSGQGRIVIQQDWAVANLTVNSEQKVWKCAKDCYVSNFALHVSGDMDTHATPTLAWDVGTNTDDDEFIAGTTIGQAGAATELTNTASSGTATEPGGFPLTAGEYIVVSVKTAAATGAAGTLTLSFDVNVLDP